jgi:RNA polymerase sigma-70 factor (ECF subfamily)
MQNQELIRLIKRSLQNDRTAFRQIVKSYQYMIFALTFRMLGNEEDAKDIVQETFIRVWTRLSDYNPEKKQHMDV